MKPRFILVHSILLAILPVMPVALAAPASERHFDGHVIVVTEVSEAGRRLPVASPENPVYFKGLSLGNRLGSIGGDREPKVSELTGFVTQLLRKQGFRGSPGAAHPPTQFLVIQWGYMSDNALEKLNFLGYNPRDDVAAAPLIDFLGPEVFRRSMRSAEITAMLALAAEPMYCISITSVDFATADTDKPVALWQTRVGVAARGLYMTDALPRMLLLADGQIGRATEKPLLRDFADLRKGNVTLGDVEILDYEDAEKAKK